MQDVAYRMKRKKSGKKQNMKTHYQKSSRERSPEGSKMMAGRNPGEETAGEAWDESGILEGRNPVMEALKAGRDINKLLVLKGNREGSIKKIIALAREKKIVIREVDRHRLDGISITGAHQGVIAYAASGKYVEVEDILEKARAKGEDPFIIILDGISDGHNLGAIIRTADCAGAHGVIIPKRRSVGLNPVVAKSSAGAIEYVPVARVTNIAQTVDSLKSRNIWIVGTDASGETAFFEKDLTGPIALVIGSEGEGIGRLVAEKCDFIVKIPVTGFISSLNASVAAAVIMYEIYRQRQKNRY